MAKFFFARLSIILFFLATSLCSCSSVTPTEKPDPRSKAASTTKENEKEASELDIPRTREEEFKQLAEALQYYDVQLYSTAKAQLEKFQTLFPLSYFAPLVELKLADCAFNLGDFPGAITAYREFERQRPKHEAIPYARVQIARSQLAQYRGVMHDQSPLQEALAGFKQLVQDFAASPYSSYGRQQISKINDLVAAHEAYVANFYQRQGLTGASENRASHLKNNFSDSPALALLP